MPSAQAPGLTRGRVAGRRSKSLFLPGDLVQPVRLLEAFEFGFTLVGEAKALAGGELSYDVGGEDVAGLGVGADAGGELDGGAEEILFFCDGLAGVEANPDV